MFGGPRHARSFVGLAIALLACNPPPNDQALPSGFVPGQACTSVRDCQPGFDCDAERGICVCTGHEACPEGSYCHPYTGRCVSALPGCDRDEQCPAGEYCDPSTRSCRAGAGWCEPCTRDGECAEAGARCLEGGYCGRPCLQDRDCGDRARCQGRQCVPGLRCSDTDGRRTGRCVDACSSDVDCMEGERCEVALGLCRPSIGCDALVPCVPDSLQRCERDADCVYGVDQVCELGRCVARRSGCAYDQVCDPVTLACVPPCRESADCRTGRTCIAGVCVPRFRCQRDQHAQCPQGMVCACPRGMSCSEPGEGECRPECRSNRDCPLRTICVESVGRRVCVPGCTRDSDCGPDEICANDGVCVPEPDACKFTAQCPACTFCEGGSCRRANGAYCVRCQVDAECGQGGVCFAGRCAPACDGICPSGFGCQRVTDRDGEARDVCLPLDGTCDTECT